VFTYLSKSNQGRSRGSIQTGDPFQTCWNGVEDPDIQESGPRAMRNVRELARFWQHARVLRLYDVTYKEGAWSPVDEHFENLNLLLIE